MTTMDERDRALAWWFGQARDAVRERVFASPGRGTTVDEVTRYLAGCHMDESYTWLVTLEGIEGQRIPVAQWAPTAVDAGLAAQGEIDESTTVFDVESIEAGTCCGCGVNPEEPARVGGWCTSCYAPTEPLPRVPMTGDEPGPPRPSRRARARLRRRRAAAARSTEVKP